uniref:LRRCT domain-containing protein n=1 Tax=Hymenolepis diminuta TaxID=6216 RepID=A0A0R3SNM9_HYMDI
LISQQLKPPLQKLSVNNNNVCRCNKQRLPLAVNQNLRKHPLKLRPKDC